MAIAFRGANGNSGNATTLTAPLPTAAIAGDFLIMIISFYGGIDFADVTGWTNMAGANTYMWDSAGANIRAKIFYKTMEPGEADPSTTTSGIRRWAISIAAYSGVDPVPFNVTENTGWSRTAIGAVTAFTPAALTASAGQWLVGLAGGTDNVTTTWTDNRTERDDREFLDTFSASSTIGDSNGTVSGSVQITFTAVGAQQGGAAVAVLLSAGASLDRPTIFGTVW